VLAVDVPQEPHERVEHEEHGGGVQERPGLQQRQGRHDGLEGGERHVAGGELSLDDVQLVLGVVQLLLGAAQVLATPCQLTIAVLTQYTLI